MRKVAQLTKVVVHLNARNDEGEVRYEKLRQASEDEVRTIVQDASLKLKGHKQCLQERTERESVLAEAARRQDCTTNEQKVTRRALDDMRAEAQEQQEKVVEQGRVRVASATDQLLALAADLRAGMAAFRDTAGKTRAELELRSGELRSGRDSELEGVRADYRRRLDDLRHAHERDLAHLHEAREQALTHLRRLHESELSTLRMQALQRRREKVHLLEQGFSEERKSLEQLISHMGFELEQQQRDAGDVGESSASMQQQTDGMRTALEQMSSRVAQAEDDVAVAHRDADEKEAEHASLERELVLLRARQQAAGLGGTPEVVAPPGRSAAAAAAGGDPALAEDLRDAIADTGRLEAGIGDLDAELADLEDELTEREKQVEILEMEIEEEQLRAHQLQARILERETAMR